jgi:hypothetical protein
MAPKKCVAKNCHGENSVSLVFTVLLALFHVPVRSLHVDACPLSKRPEISEKHVEWTGGI